MAPGFLALERTPALTAEGQEAMGWSARPRGSRGRGAAAPGNLPPPPGCQQEHFFAALRVGARHLGALQTMAVLRGAPLTAARVHGSGLRAGRGVSGSERRQQEQQHQRGDRRPIYCFSRQGFSV